MSDVVDQAGELEESQRRIALAAALPRGDAGGRDRCIDCHAEIPAARRAVAVWAVRCVRCQGAIERGGAAR